MEQKEQNIYQDFYELQKSYAQLREALEGTASRLLALTGLKPEGATLESILQEVEKQLNKTSDEKPE